MRRALLALAALLVLTSCGYIGDPLPPSLNIPSRIADLRVVQREDKLIVDFTVPLLATDGAPMKRIGSVDLEIGGTRIQVDADKPGPVHLEVPAKEWTGKEAEVQVRANNTRDRSGPWSEKVLVKVSEPLGAPDVQAESDAKGVHLRWPEVRAGATYRVFRLDRKNPFLVDRPEFLDTEAQYGTPYQYKVQALLGTAEGPVSRVVAFTAKDTFPPAVPSGLAAVTGVDTVELNWDPNTEADLKGYRVYRSVGSGAMAALADSDQPSFSDKKVEAGKSYKYAVSSLDQNGNESKQSAPVEAVLR